MKFPDLTDKSKKDQADKTWKQLYPVLEIILYLYE